MGSALWKLIKENCDFVANLELQRRSPWWAGGGGGVREIYRMIKECWVTYAIVDGLRLLR